ncbi:flagellar biosynthesis protein FlhA [Desulfacinum hydrothermale DSM 13146]|uniref:Flagellar biosynthesis protein FlhA n=1 Tax=Desulfacinum hydrothermale DSM 13146 TaxID=1121390 RepID=A0A1W1X6K7_9BACT|nr:flagellar biosynthesis protein FlhA [Desulfacinum hydrothermale]SMC19358.1 flagellar biosynthesis protein FlhA [Desulfacinum hydrothermale DSM 13146]
MAEPSQVSTDNWLARLRAFSEGDALMGIGVVVILAVMLLPIPGPLMDVLLATNISFGLLILLTTIYTQKPLDFGIFPTLLLITTLFRLALNVASTRLILLRGDMGTEAAGHVIQAFGQFVVGGNYVIGLVIFVILVIVNFVVITKGTERISEVAARFTLDAMPGKQMSIDADLNAGLIDDQEARSRRAEIMREADFYGTMDGASKFVRGDAIAGILITLINILGGLAIGVLQRDMEVVEALRTYTLLTVGDGLVSQIPALIISTAAGILVSRAELDTGMGRAFGRQLGLNPKPLAIAGGMLGCLGLVPGFPFVPLFLVGGGLLGLAYRQHQRIGKKEMEDKQVEPQEEGTGDTASPALPPPLDLLELEVGYGLIPLVDGDRQSDLLGRIRSIRQQLALDYGIVVPSLHVRDNLQLKPSEYRLLLKGNPVARAELMLGHHLALTPSDPEGAPIEGIPTKDPAFGLPALWVPDKKKGEAARAGLTLIDLPTVVATHLTELFKKYAAHFLTRQTVQQLLDILAESQPKLVEDLTPNPLPLGTVQKVLQNLVRERVSIRDLQTICETLAEQGAVTKDPDILTEYVRQALARTITRPYESEEGRLHVISLHPATEERLAQSIQRTEHGAFLSMDPESMQQLVQATSVEVQRAANAGHHPVILTSPVVRRHLKRLLERFLPDVVVISHSELAELAEIQSIGTIKVTHAD